MPKKINIPKTIPHFDVPVTDVPFLKVKLLTKASKLPVKAHHDDLGYDLFASEQVKLLPGKVGIVSIGIECHFPPKIGGLIRDRSSVATKLGLIVVAGVIDSQYTGEIKVAFLNTTKKAIMVKVGDKIAQMILLPSIYCPVFEVKEIPVTARGKQGFGSTGKK